MANQTVAGELQHLKVSRIIQIILQPKMYFRQIIKVQMHPNDKTIQYGMQ